MKVKKYAIYGNTSSDTPQLQQHDASRTNKDTKMKRKYITAASSSKPVTPDLASLFSDGATSVDLASCGAVANVDTHEMGSANAAALQRCLEAADTVDGVGEVVVSSTYTLTPMYVAGLSDVTLRVEGELRASTNVTAWPTGA